MDDYLDGALEPTRAGDLEGHLGRCPACADRLSEIRELRGALRDMPVPAPSRDLMAGARERASRSHRGRITALAGALGVAAAVLLTLAVGWFQAPSRPAGHIATVALTPGRTETVGLVFNSPERMKGVTLSLDLPGNMALVGFPHRKRLSWKTDLKPGRNLLKLPVVLHRARPGLLKADLSYGGQQRRFELHVEPKPSGQSALKPGTRRI